VQDYGIELQAEDVETLQYLIAGRRQHTPQQVYCNTTGDESEISCFLIIFNVRASNDLCKKNWFSTKRKLKNI
jgi:hypothetical protein